MIDAFEEAKYHWLSWYFGRYGNRLLWTVQQKQHQRKVGGYCLKQESLDKVMCYLYKKESIDVQWKL